uniref:Trafficking protein particle complex subunit n=1 Tax=Solanum tuberosum TaxID=4113 RepID=M1CUB4_SOLTU
MAPVAPRSGDAIFANVERVNAELFTIRYGAIVRQLLTDLEELKSLPSWPQMFLGVTATVGNWNAEGTTCSLILEDNPLVDFVELPDTCQGLYYCNILSGVIRGALEMVSMKTEVTWIRDMLRGDDAFELQLKLLKQVPEEYPYKDDE